MVAYGVVEKLWACAVAAAFAAGLGAAPALAEPPSLDLPLDCTPGKDCWVVNYMDRDPTDGRSDYRCGWLTYDGHKGTDIAVRDLGVMGQGVSVSAAAPGTVIGTRDGMRDVNVKQIGGRAALEGKDCGNMVAIHHGDGWVTQYCHMRNGSVHVRKGMNVRRGQPIGLVGLSGATEFPHIHMHVSHGKTIVDPFVGIDGGEKCQTGTHPLWTAGALAKLAYKSVALKSAGFAAKQPKLSAVRRGLHRERALARRAPWLVFWVDTFWTNAGDQLVITVTAPDGRVILETNKVLTQLKASYLFFSGVRRKQAQWPAGTYVGRARLIRASGPAGPEDLSIERLIELR